MVDNMNDDELIQTLRRLLRKSKEYTTAVEAIEKTFIGGAWLNLYTEVHESKTFAKQAAWAGAQNQLKTLWDTTRRLVSSNCDMQGEPVV